MPDPDPGPAPLPTDAALDAARDLAPEAAPITGEPLPLGVEPTRTGHPAVDAALARLEALDGVPTEAHVAVYEDVHQRLTDTLAALDRDDPLGSTARNDP
ncbi:hypothetical protein [Kitasatospora sp. NPDC058218]|uniref:hypothetical protein n=1 Tax=Kitasatospora sp. NPDC058218 TaxID=3346385 RepID=UPI0036DABE26